jgi:hypothetical protein
MTTDFSSRKPTGFKDHKGVDICIGDIIINQFSKPINSDGDQVPVARDACRRLVVTQDTAGGFSLMGESESNGNLAGYCAGCWGGPPEVIGNILENPDAIPASTMALIQANPPKT